jgi:hypothetical protein
MGNHILTEKQKVENCDYLFNKLKKCLDSKKDNDEVTISFPHSGVGVLNCKNLKSYTDFIKDNSKHLTILQKGNTITNKHLLEYSVTPSTVRVILEDESYFYFT